MSSSPLVDLFGFPATLVHGDPMVLDRWRWLCEHLPRTRNEERVLEVGCGSGAFTIGAARRGYQSLGLSWNAADVAKAQERAALCGVEGKAEFVVGDARELDRRPELVGQFETVICCEVIEHILDDLRLMKALHACVKPGGRLLMTAPNRDYRAITAPDDGPHPKTETGWHVRRGYSAVMFRELCDQAGFVVEDISFCSGWVSQKLTWLWRQAGRLDQRVGWLSVLPLRPLPLFLERPVQWLRPWPAFSTCLVAYRPRFAERITESSSVTHRSVKAV